ncbi:hypothetical protein GC011_04915 [Staphylococcus pseudintermedius]|nr:hypothetical protein [Staphylococcus pseudintermedius]
MQYSPKQVINMMKRYNENKKTLARLKAIYDKEVTTGEGVAQYGDDASMPKSKNVSDPTFKRAKQLMESNNIVANLQNKVDFIENNADKLIKDRHIIVFTLRIQGHTCEYIGDVLTTSRQTVHTTINEIAQVLCKSDEEYEAYKQKQLKKYASK